MSTARRDDYRAFSKAQVIERILRENAVEGASLLGFGDGYVEIQNVKAVGGLAVAVASDEAGRSGRADPWKRDRLRRGRHRHPGLSRLSALLISLEREEYRELFRVAQRLADRAVPHPTVGRGIMPFELFDRSLLRLRPLAERTHDMDRSLAHLPGRPAATLRARVAADAGRPDRRGRSATAGR